MTQEPVANGEYSSVIGEFKASGINNLSEEDMDTLTHKIEDFLLKQALRNKKKQGLGHEKNGKEQEAVRRTPRERKERHSQRKRR
jgi:hypothetical protein